MLELILKPWPWYVAGPLIGLIVPALLILGNKSFGISSSRNYHYLEKVAEILKRSHNYKIVLCEKTKNIFAEGISIQTEKMKKRMENIQKYFEDYKNNHLDKHVKLFKHQEEGIVKALFHKKFGIFDEQGLGKLSKGYSGLMLE